MHHGTPSLDVSCVSAGVEQATHPQRQVVGVQVEVLCWRPWRQVYLQLGTRVLLNHLLKPSCLGVKEEYVWHQA